MEINVLIALLALLSWDFPEQTFCLLDGKDKQDGVELELKLKKFMEKDDGDQRKELSSQILDGISDIWDQTEAAIAYLSKTHKDELIDGLKTDLIFLEKFKSEISMITAKAPLGQIMIKAYHDFIDLLNKYFSITLDSQEGKPVEEPVNKQQFIDLLLGVGLEVLSNIDELHKTDRDAEFEGAKEAADLMRNLFERVRKITPYTYPLRQFLLMDLDIDIIFFESRMKLARAN